MNEDEEYSHCGDVCLFKPNCIDLGECIDREGLSLGEPEDES